MRLNGLLFSFVLAVLTVSLATFPISAGTLSDACSGPTISTSFKSVEWTSPGASSCYSIYFDGPTAWFVRAAAGPTSAGVYLELPACSRDAGLRVIDRRLDSLLVDVREAGWRSICFGQIERGGDPVEVELLSRALGAGLVKGDPTEDEPDPDPLRVDEGAFGAAAKNDPTEDEPDPDPLMGDACSDQLAVKNDPTEDEPDPDPLMGSGVCGPRNSRVARLCHEAGAWGAANIPSCAAHLASGQWVEPGGGRWYRLHVAQWQNLTFEADGLTSVSIRDAKGHRMAGGSADAVTVSLAPGSYWVEATGDRFRYGASGF